MRRFFRQYGRLVLALAAVLALCAALPALFQQSRAIETGSWGLSFRTEGKAPVGNASADALRRYDAVYLGDETEKKIYLTFDAGYENGCTEPILDALAAEEFGNGMTTIEMKQMAQLYLFLHAHRARFLRPGTRLWLHYVRRRI